ncbi:hypothetical protein [Streptomyces neyagawaensis]|uniref:hypothetical protein n=1 Tax=Streptomyces neyagawaensis TaxID=42238 RepID=UPI0006E2B74E|nr:hypothetical protein [Streptomyces neyagawaensis]MCL6737729.1 hypothetical protein [Streptomyces neyagawaensis]MDE1687720.1 hypothetical protein [Streptomyces neyagawaensis]MDG5808480.1 hypothetical protein [Streptomyces ossamyceticus]
MSAPDDSIASFAAVLAGELPGQWSSQTQPDLNGHAAEDDLTAAVWDMDQVADALAKHSVNHWAVVTRPADGTRLFVMDRKGRDDGFLIAAMAPENLPAEAFRGVREPDGLAVDANPFRAAKHVRLRLLPRYEQALAQVRDNASRLAAAARVKQTVVMTWSGEDIVTAEPDRDDIVQALTEYGFALHEDRHVFVLSDGDSARVAAAVRAVGHRLSELGVGVLLSRPAGRPALATAPVQPPASPVPHRVR